MKALRSPHAADDSLLAMLTSNKLQDMATPRSKDPLSASTPHSLSAKAGGLDRYAPAWIDTLPCAAGSIRRSLLSGKADGQDECWGVTEHVQ